MDDLINVLSKIFKLGKVAHAKVHHALHQQAIGGGVDFGEVAKLLIHKKGAKPVMSDPRIIEMLGSLADGVGELFNLNPDMVHTFHKHLIGGWKMPTMAQATAVAKFGKEMYDLGKPMYDAYNKKGGWNFEGHESGPLFSIWRRMAETQDTSGGPNYPVPAPPFNTGGAWKLPTMAQATAAAKFGKEMYDLGKPMYDAYNKKGGRTPTKQHRAYNKKGGAWKLPTMAQATAAAKFGKEMYDLGKPMYDAYNKKGGRTPTKQHRAYNKKGGAWKLPTMAQATAAAKFGKEMYDLGKPMYDAYNKKGGACAKNYAPVMGTNGVRYSNMCSLKEAGATPSAGIPSGIVKGGAWKLPTMAQATAAAKFGKEMYDLGKPMYDAYNKKGGRRAPTAHSLAVKRVMQEHGMKLGQASKYVKEHGLAHM